APGVQMEVTPTMRGAVMRFTFPEDADAANIIFGSPTNNRHGESDTVAGMLSGRTATFPNEDDGGQTWTAFVTDTNEIGFSLGGNNSRTQFANSGAGRMWMYGEFDTAPTSFITTTLANGATSARSIATFPLNPNGETVIEMRVATSWMSAEQAQRNLELEIGIGDSDRWFDEIFVEAYDIWEEMLETVIVNDIGVDEDCWINYWDLVDLYSKIQRSIMYPTTKHENVATGTVAEANANPVYRHVTPYRGTAAAPVIRDGVFVYNEGFWDTFRTKWGGVSLLWPELTGTLADGWVSHFTDQDSRGNFAIPRWNNPGNADLMVMTSSDVILAELIMRGIEFEQEDGLASGRKSATVVSRANPQGGRKGLQESIFRGWTPWNASAPIGGGGDRGVAWTLEGFTNDSGLSHAAGRMADQYIADGGLTTSDIYRDFRAEQVYFGNRAVYFQNTMNPTPVRLPSWVRDIPEDVLDESGQYIITPFARQRYRDGSWANLRPSGAVGPGDGGGQPARDWCPWIWGWGYTEENAFPFAIMVMQDGVGLANVHGGPAALGNYMDWLMTDTNNVFGGGYGGWIHEIPGKREVKMGQFGSNNQTAYHVPFMYLYSDRPEMASYWVHTMLNRGFNGAGVHRAYLGEEDNGAKSSFYYLSVLGLMSLNMGSGHMTLTTPKFPDVTINPIGAHRPIHIQAHDADGRYNVFFDGLRVNGENWGQMDIGPELLFAHTDTPLVIEFDTTSDREAANEFQWGGSYEGGLQPPLSWTEEFNSEGLAPDMLMDVTYDDQLVNWGNMTETNYHPNLFNGNEGRITMARPEIGGDPIDGTTVPVIGGNVTEADIIEALQDLPEGRNRAVFATNIPAQRNLLTATGAAAALQNQYQRGGARNLFDNVSVSG
ncbi:MAG: glycoside hydrolase family 92 protein, partial [Oscillospiraceae bacterium]|nr:glycoside hydrolase family 92 protein [Oscillospiraceae bacterium]